MDPCALSTLSFLCFLCCLLFKNMRTLQRHQPLVAQRKKGVLAGVSISIAFVFFVSIVVFVVPFFIRSIGPLRETSFRVSFASRAS
jgi:hypothetical protein